MCKFLRGVDCKWAYHFFEMISGADYSHCYSSYMVYSTWQDASARREKEESYETIFQKTLLCVLPRSNCHLWNQSEWSPRTVNISEWNRAPSTNDGKSINDIQKQYMMWASHADDTTTERRVIRKETVLLHCEVCQAFQFEYCMSPMKLTGNEKRTMLLKWLTSGTINPS